MVIRWTILLGWWALAGSGLLAQEIAWSAPQMKPQGDRSAVAESWLGTVGDHTYLALAGDKAAHIVQFDATGAVAGHLDPDLKVGRSQGTYLYSALLVDRLLVFAATSRGKSVAYQVMARAFGLPDLEPLGRWQRIETGPYKLGEHVGSPRTFALTVSPDRRRFGLLSAPYPNVRIKGHSMIGVVADTGLQVLARHLIHARQGDPLPQPDGFAVDDSGRMLLYQHDRSAGRWQAKVLPLSGEPQPMTIAQEGLFLHSGMLAPGPKGWTWVGFYGEAAHPAHQGMYHTQLDLAAGKHGPVHTQPLLGHLPPRMTDQARFSLDLQLFAYQPTHWLARPEGGHFLVAEQRLLDGNNEPSQRQVAQIAAPHLFPQLRESPRSYLYQGVVIVALQADGTVEGMQFLPRQGRSKVALHHAPTHGPAPRPEQEVGLGYAAALHEGTLHLAFNEYPEELGQPLSARSHNGKFRQAETSLIHWRWDGTSQPKSWPLFANASTAIFLQPPRCAQTTSDQWWLYGSTTSPRQFFVGLLRWE